MVAAWTCSLAAQDRIPWVTDLQTARQLAQQQRRLVLLHFWTEGCMPCQRLEHHVFNQPELIRAISTGYVPVKINAQHSARLADYYRIASVPTDIIVDASGKELYRSTSPQDPNRYIAMLDSVKAHNSVGFQTPPPQPHAMPSASLGSSTGNASPSANALSTNPLGATAVPSGNPTATGAGPQSGMLENPYANSLTQNAPPQAATNFAPAYGNSMAGQQSAEQANGDYLRNGSRWGNTPAAEAANPSSGSTHPAAGPAFAAGGQSQPQWSPGAAASSPQQNMALHNPAGSASAATDVGLQHNNATPWQAQPSQDRMASLAPQNPSNLGQAPAMDAVNGLDGYCPVTLMEQSQWVKGDARWGINHRGRTYLFFSDQHRQRFWADPDRFAPVLSGYDAVRFVEGGQLVSGKREHGVFYRDRIYLFADEAALERFGQRPDDYVTAANRAQQQSNAAGLR
jgi:thioredoxin-related protein/YHS domain-containing protein